MAQIKIYGRRDFLAERKRAISDTLHSCAVAGLGLPADKRFHRFIALEAEDFIHPTDRTELGISPQDVEITIHESPKENWGIRGKLGHELVLNYQVEK